MYFVFWGPEGYNGKNIISFLIYILGKPSQELLGSKLYEIERHMVNSCRSYNEAILEEQCASQLAIFNKVYGKQRDGGLQCGVLELQKKVEQLEIVKKELKEENTKLEEEKVPNGSLGVLLDVRLKRY